MRRGMRTSTSRHEDETGGRRSEALGSQEPGRCPKESFRHLKAASYHIDACTFPGSDKSDNGINWTSLHATSRYRVHQCAATSARLHWGLRTETNSPSGVCGNEESA